MTRTLLTVFQSTSARIRTRTSKSPTLFGECKRQLSLGRPVTSDSRPPDQAGAFKQRQALETTFFTQKHEHGLPTGNGPDPADVGRTIQVLTTRLPFLLREGVLPLDVFSETITLELLPSTLGLPEIKGKTAYAAISRMGAWSLNTLVPRAELVIDSQKLIGSARRCERLVVRFRLLNSDAAVVYTGLFHFYFDSCGKVSRHIFEIVDNKFKPSHIVDWLMGKKLTEKNLGYCYQRCESGKRQ